MPRLTLTLQLDVEERLPGGNVVDLMACLHDYLTNPECPLLEDYGPKAWGGYDGAFITKAEVTKGEIVA